MKTADYPVWLAPLTPDEIRQLRAQQAEQSRAMTCH